LHRAAPGDDLMLSVLASVTGSAPLGHLRAHGRMVQVVRRMALWSPVERSCRGLTLKGSIEATA